eukprot:scaffold705_cov402-Prasinococcus_capsulatus_cf.AAC.31
MGGESEKLARVAKQSLGWRSALLVRRGHFGEPLDTPKFTLLGNPHVRRLLRPTVHLKTSDTEEAILYVRKKFPRAPIVIAGCSAGTGDIVKYVRRRAR